MEQLKHIKETLTNQVLSQINNIECVDTEELGDVIDMIKDLDQAIYYCTVVKAMEDHEKEEKAEYPKEVSNYYYTERLYRPPHEEYRDYDRDYGRMYYRDGGNGSSMNTGNNTSTAYYTEREYGIPMRDVREGRSPVSRRNYMEAKELHHDKATQIHELEKYMQELSQDVTEMIKDASPEEKQILQRKISSLASKVDSLSV